MQTITDDLRAILVSHFQAGADGFRGRVEIGVTPVSYRITRASPSKSLGTDSDRCEIDIDNHDGSVDLSTLLPDMPIKVFQWYGDIANQIQTFYGLIDRVAPHRHPNMITVSARDWMKKLIVQHATLIGPQAATDPAAIRDPSNFVYLDWEVSAIVTDLLDRASFPGGGQRAITTTAVTVAEFTLADDEPFAKALSRLADLAPIFLSYCDELGIYHFEPNTVGAARDPDYTYQTGVDIVVLDTETDDDRSFTRVLASGPMNVTSNVDAWSEMWQTPVIAHPVGVYYDPADSANLRVLDSRTKRIYTLRQSDRAIIASVYIGNQVPYPIGLSGDPGDAAVYWVANVPCWETGGPVNGVQGGNRIYKFRKSDNMLLASYALPNGAWSDMKVSAALVWLTGYLTNQISSFSRATLAHVADYTLLNAGQPIKNPTGIAIDGTTLDVFYAAGQSYVIDEGDPTGPWRQINSSVGMYGGDYDTTTHTELYVVSSALSRVWKYTTAIISQTSVVVSAWAINDTFEAELLALSGTPEIRVLFVPMVAVLSQADAQAMADTMLAKVSHFHSTMDIGVIGNPALQKTDMIRVIDPVLGISSDWQADTYQGDMAGDAGTYVGRLSMKPWVA